MCMDGAVSPSRAERVMSPSARFTENKANVPGGDAFRSSALLRVDCICPRNVLGGFPVPNDWIFGLVLAFLD